MFITAIFDVLIFLFLKKLALLLFFYILIAQDIIKYTPKQRKLRSRTLNYKQNSTNAFIFINPHIIHPYTLVITSFLKFLIPVIANVNVNKNFRVALTLLAKITKFTNNIKFGLDVVKTNYRVSSSPLCGESTLCGENTVCDETVYHETNQLPEPPSLVINNIYSEADFISVLYNDLSTLTVFSSVNLIFESHMQVLTSDLVNIT